MIVRMLSRRCLEYVTMATVFGYVWHHLEMSGVIYDRGIISLLLLNFLVSIVLQERYPITGFDLVFRHSDPGLSYTLVFPVCDYLLNIPGDTFTLILYPTTLIIYTLWLYKPNISWKTTLVWCVFTAYCLAQMVYVYRIQTHINNDIVYVVTMSILYVCVLIKLPEWFPLSFTFGEVVMVTQIFFYLCHRVLHKWNESTEPLDRLTGIVFCAVVLETYLLVLFRNRNWPTFVICCTVLLTGCGFVLPALYIYLGISGTQSMILDLIPSNTSVLLLTWWIVCTAMSIFIVCYYGNQTSNYGYKNGSHGNTTKTDRYSDRTKKINKDSLASHQMKSIDNNVHTSYTNERTKVTKQLDEKIKAESKKVQTMHSYSQTDAGLHKQDIGSQTVSNTVNSDNSYHLSLKQTDSSKNRSHMTVQCHVTTITRKYFHLVMLCVYIPGLMYNPQLLYLASTVAAALLVIIEMVRVLDYLPSNSVLNQYLQVFLDQQDRGQLILTPIYLLIGCSLPLWLTNQNSGSVPGLVFYAGLLSVGIGDSAASIFGQKFGYHKWPDCKKSVEGTVASVICQLGAIQLLRCIGVPCVSTLLSMIVSVTLVSCVESVTKQIDNLVLPLVAFMLFTSTQLGRITE